MQVLNYVWWEMVEPVRAGLTSGGRSDPLACYEPRSCPLIHRMRKLDIRT
jgi:hypothetical protein